MQGSQGTRVSLCVVQHTTSQFNRVAVGYCCFCTTWCLTERCNLLELDTTSPSCTQPYTYVRPYGHQPGAKTEPCSYAVSGNSNTVSSQVLVEPVAHNMCCAAERHCNPGHQHTQLQRQLDRCISP